MSDKKPTVAMGMLQKAKSVDDRSSSYHDTIKRNIQRDVLDALQTKKEELEDRIFTLSDFSLETDVNKGTSAVSRDEGERTHGIYKLTMNESDGELRGQVDHVEEEPYLHLRIAGGVSEGGDIRLLLTK